MPTNQVSLHIDPGRSPLNSRELHTVEQAESRHCLGMVPNFGAERLVAIELGFVRHCTVKIDAKT